MLVHVLKEYRTELRICSFITKTGQVLWPMLRSLSFTWNNTSNNNADQQGLIIHLFNHIWVYLTYPNLLGFLPERQLRI